ncbi:choice-of-anchor D domain-containing protein [Marinobacter sp. LQ44]|uniref:choice-of-anchor D domain-containing protein n=1 Tax=unclassified Marinobacter TaxID=83889 RepID=UPI000718C4E0|nr:choice-of-anchor D domain-containing protein [Marinobacter sp. LQ44]AMQ90270.1 hypothetical protein ASQ50_17085 [Marinobacter sp. LQ44]
MKLRNLNTSVRKLGPAVAAAALLAGGASNASAEPVSIELAFECPFPLIGTQPIRAQISADIPTVANVGEPTPQFEVTAITVVNDDARTGLKLVGSETVEGIATSFNTVVTANRSLEQIVELTIPPTFIPNVSGEFNVPASGLAPEVLFTEDDIGEAEIRVGGLTLDLTARTPNGDIAPAPIGEILTDCVQLPDQDNLLQTILVSGEVSEAPRIGVNREDLAFGNVQAGLTAEQTVTVSNTGNAALGINNVTISGTDADAFLQTNNCASLAPSASCDVNVTFAPSTEGTRNATLTIESTDADNPAVDVALTGRGVLAPTPEIGVNPDAVDLGRIQLGQSASAEVTISNSGNEVLLIDSIALEGASAADFVQTNNCTTIAANESCTVELSYTANAVGVSNANLVIRSDDPETPEVSVPVSAEAFEQTGSKLELLLGLEGSTFIKSSGGTLPLNGSIATLLDLAAGTFEADLELDPTYGNFSIKLLFSRLNASANVEFEQADVTTGTLINGKLTANSQLYVKVPKVAIKVFGLPLRVGGGAECMTREPVSIDLASVEGSNFSPATGGTVNGVYDLPPLENCGLLTGLLNQFLTGSGNTIELELTPEQ